MFKPARLVYDTTNGSAKALGTQPTAAAPEATASAAAPAVEAAQVAKAQAGAEIKNSLAKLKAGITSGIDSLRDVLKDNFQEFGERLSISGTKMIVAVPPDLDFMGQRYAKAAEFKRIWQTKDLQGAANLLKNNADPTISEGDIIDTLSQTFAYTVLAKARDAFEEKYPALKTPANFVEFNKENPGFSFTATVEFTGNSVSGVTIDCSDPVKIVEAHVKFAEKKKIELQKAGAKGPETPADRTRADRVEAFQKSWPAKIMVWLGLVPMKKGSDPDGKPVDKPDWESVLAGNDPIATMLIGGCGGKALLDKPESFDEMFANVPDGKPKEMVEAFFTKAQESAGSLVKVAAKFEAGGAATPPERFNNDKFGEWMAGKNGRGEKVEMPKNGFALERDYIFGNGNKAVSLTVNLTGDAEIILPKGSRLVIKNGEKTDTISAEKDTVSLKDRELVIIGTIEKGTIFRAVEPKPQYKEEKIVKS